MPEDAKTKLLPVPIPRGPEESGLLGKEAGIHSSFRLMFPRQARVRLEYVINLIIVLHSMKDKGCPVRGSHGE